MSSQPFMERYGSHDDMMPELIAKLQVPFLAVKPETKVVIFTDTQMDPRVWQAAMSVMHAKGATPVLCMFPRLRYINDNPPETAIEAARQSDLCVYLTTTMLAASPGMHKMRGAIAPFQRKSNDDLAASRKRGVSKLMEESTIEILTRCGGNATLEDVREMTEIQRRIAEVYQQSHVMHITSDYGMDITCRIDEVPPGRLVSMWGEGREDQLGGTWPTGEIHIEPVPYTMNGLLVWDTTAPWPSGMWKDPVKVKIEKGKVTSIEGRSEAQQVREYFKKWGDENFMQCGGEISVGTNKLCYRTGIMRSEKKRLGTMHFGVGHGADRGIINSNMRFEGIIDSPTVVVDDKIAICEKNAIKV